MKRGIVIGKFYPPHKGHKYLIDFATKQVDSLTVIVCHKDGQKIHGDVRAGWLRQIHPKVKVIVVDDIGHDDDSKMWAEYTLKFLGYRPDVVFTSESYGDGYAYYMGCKHILVDKKRINVPISATKIRNKPDKYLQYLEPWVRANFIKKVCVVGAESTGTTTLSKDLANHYKTIWVPEFGRFFSESLRYLEKYKWFTSDFDTIADVQNNLSQKFMSQANRVLIGDTDAFATTLWHKRYMGYESKSVDKISKNFEWDVYFLTGDEIPFEQDGIRDGEHIRHQMHNEFIAKLEEKNKRFVLLQGSREERLAKAIKEVDSLLAKSIFDF